MAGIPGTVGLTGIIAPKDAADEYAVHEDIYGKGGFRVEATLFDRNNISELRRKEGMLCYVVETNITYQLLGGITNDDWVEFTLGGGGGDSNISFLTKEPTGFLDINESLISFTNATRTFTIQPNVAGGYSSYEVVISGQSFVKSTATNLVIPDVESTFFFYFNNTGTLVYSQTFPSTLKDIAIVALVYWNAVDKRVEFFGEERHGLVMDWATHGYLHNTVGAAYSSGLRLAYIAESDGASDADVQVSLTDGVIYDEDLRHNIHHGLSTTNFFEQRMFPVLWAPIWYRTGSQGLWRKFEGTSYPVHFGTSAITYNQYTGSTWQLTDVPNNSYSCMWMFASNEVRDPILMVMGQYTEVSLEKCLELNNLENLELGILPTPEFKLLYRLTYNVKYNYGNSLNCVLVDVTDFRGFSDASVSGTGTSISGYISDKHYAHVQLSALDTWTINHGMNKVPAVSVYDELENEVVGDIEIVDINNIIITFNEPFAGTAYLN